MPSPQDRFNLDRARLAYDARRRKNADDPAKQRERAVRSIQQELKKLKAEFDKKAAADKKDKTKKDRADAKARRSRSAAPGPLQRGAGRVQKGLDTAVSAVRSGAALAARLATGPFEAGIEFRTQLIKNQDFIKESLIDSAATLFRAAPFVAVLERRVRALIDQRQSQLLDRILSDEILGNIAVRLQEDPAFQRFAAKTAAKEFKRTDEYRRIQQLAADGPGPPS